MAGRLVLCPTPIGNLADITLRALEELRGADVILVEDTRRTTVLLRYHGITRPMLSYHEHNEAARLPEILQRWEAGQRVLLVSDAGTPCLADPGYRLVQAAVAAGVEITALPGPSALLPALTVSGLPVHAFAFYGFVPRGSGARDAAVRDSLSRPLTAIWYESPQRLTGTLACMQTLGFGDRAAAVARELTKVHEEVIRGSLTELADHFGQFPPRGEIVLCVGPAPEKAVLCEDMQSALEEVERRSAAGEALSPAVAAVAAELCIRRRRLYAAAVSRRGGS